MKKYTKPSREEIRGRLTKIQYEITQESGTEYNVPYRVDNPRERDCLIFDTAG